MASIRQSANDPIPLPPGSSQVIVLIADNDESAVQTLKAALEAGGYTVLEADNFQQMFFLIDQRRPHLLLLGEHLNDTDGRWACRQIKGDDGLGFVPVILMSDQNPRPPGDESILSPDATVSKPINREDLETWMRYLLRMKRQFDRPNRRRAIETQELHLLKSDIITTVSHELRTPMVQVKAAVSLLTEDIKENGRPDQMRIASMATQAAARLEGAIENIRQLAQTHQITLQPVVVDEATDLSIRHLARNWTSREGSGRVEKHLEADLPLAWADKRALGRLLQLLLDNALKFSSAEEPVYVVAETYDTDHIWIAVQDFGIGIPEEEHDNIFSAFYQVDASSTRNYPGTGTGLALALLLASGMNTVIQLDSTPGEGSTFSFLLPIAKPDAADHSPA
ncbi:MAG: response regulator [Anaerolineae bacterium]|nr:response regulator [Anaerolineae bacterium]